MSKLNYTKYSKDDLRNMLISLGYDKDEIFPLKVIELVEILENQESDTLLSLEGAELEEDDIPINKKEIGPSMSGLPQIGTPEWQEYVTSKFTDSDKWVFDEKDANGKPKKIETISAKALARVGREIFGQPLSEGTIREELSFTGPKGLPYAYVVYQVVLNSPNGPRAFTAVADTSYLNTEDKFLAFPLRTSETKAMGCAWVKALGISVYTKEEMPTKDAAKAVEETSADWKGTEDITNHQKKTIMNLCSKLRITVNRLLNMTVVSRNANKEVTACLYDGKVQRFDDLDDPRLTKANGTNLIDILNKMQRNEIPVHESFRGSDNE